LATGAARPPSEGVKLKAIKKDRPRRQRLLDVNLWLDGQPMATVHSPISAIPKQARK